MKGKIEQASDNLYADLGLKNTEELQSKSVLAREIYRIIKAKKLSQPKAAKLLGIKQPALSNLLQGKLMGFSTDRLMRILNQLGQDIDIKIKPSRRKDPIGRMSIHTSYHDTPSIIPIAAKNKD